MKMFNRFFKDREDDDEDYTVIKVCFHCGKDGEYEEDEDTCRYCRFPI